MLMVECNAPFGTPPVLKVSFTQGSSAVSYPIKLPILLTHFMAPVVLPAADFLVRWDRLTAPGLDQSVVVPTSLTPGPVATVRVQQLKLGVVAGPDGSLLCASTLATKAEDGSKVLVGCMVKVVVTAGRATITVRTASAHATPTLAQTLAAALATH